jgi:phosphinothricin acetyltransferase
MATSADASALAELYNYYIAHSVVTFEETPITALQMEERIRGVLVHWPWLVFEEENESLGYAYATAWKPRSAYRFTVEVTVYVRHGHVGKGIGKSLYTELISQLKTAGVHAVIGGITLPNPASQALHESLGFVKVAHFKETGFKFGEWRDVGYWELIV